MKTWSFILFGLLLMFGACKMSVKERNKKMLAEYARYNDSILGTVDIKCADYKLISVKSVSRASLMDTMMLYAHRWMIQYADDIKDCEKSLVGDREHLEWDLDFAKDHSSGQNAVVDAKKEITYDEKVLDFKKSEFDYYKNVTDSLKSAPIPVGNMLVVTYSYAVVESPSTKKTPNRGGGFFYANENCEIVHLFQCPNSVTVKDPGNRKDFLKKTIGRII